MKIIFIIPFVCLLFYFKSGICQVELKGVTFSDTYNLDNKLVLNGAGVRKKGPIDLYVAGLYLTSKKNDAIEIINSAEPMAVKIVITSGMVSSKKMDKAIREGFSKSINGDESAYQERIDRFTKALSEDITKGITYDLIYVSDKNIIRLLKNEVFVIEIQGFDFKKVLFGIWLGSDPVDKDLKKGMLGEK